MTLSIPIYIEERRHKRFRHRITFLVRPLFFPTPSRENMRLDRAMSGLMKELIRTLRGQDRSDRHDAIASLSYSPDIESAPLEIEIRGKTGTERATFLFVILKTLGRRVAFTPSLPELWFDLDREEDLRVRAEESIRRYLSDVAREQGGPVDLEPLRLSGKASIRYVQLHHVPLRKREKKEVSNLALLGVAENLSGAEELDRVGTCLDWSYPTELDRALHREEIVTQAVRLLAAADKRPVLLVGARRVGKTAIVHECVFRRVDARPRHDRYVSRNNLWHLSPQRLISGMSYVGQWEDRLISILKDAQKKQHILYFDDLLGLFQAGVSRDSDLSVAHVLKPYLERRDIRLLGEITPEAHAILKEKDRGFADQFHVIRVREPSENQTLRILIAVSCRLEEEQGCRFELDVLPSLIDFQRRYGRDAAFPGKAAAPLKELANKFDHRTIGREQLLEELRARTGFSTAFLSSETRLERTDIVSGLESRLVGQAEAVNAAADVITLAKARLQDPDRPMASFLFLGPTGVGKTQCAKAIAAYLFGDPERLLRFDLNEYVSSDSVARLIGTFHQPDGLLTGAVRQRPFCVLLLDEIEKAHPDVLDLLLQVLGEGRLTDARGRTANFTNTIIILTSNLGVREAGNAIGFRDDSGIDTQAFVSAARNYFRPEFFNRLDRIIPFQPLSREEIGRIACHLISDLFRRHGLRQRKCSLRVDPAAMARIIDEGYHPQLGARALKRVTERRLAQPVAECLARLKPGHPTVVELLPAPGGFTVLARGLEPARFVAPASESLSDDPAIQLQRVRAVLRRINRIQLPHSKLPSDKRELRPEQVRYIAVKEQSQHVREMAEQFQDWLEETRGTSVRVAPPALSNRMRTQNVKIRHRWDLSGHDKLLLAQDMREAMRELRAASIPVSGDPHALLKRLVRETALLHLMSLSPEDDLSDRALLLLRPAHTLLMELYLGLFRNIPGTDAAPVALPADRSRDPKTASSSDTFGGILLRGPNVLKLARIEVGTHLLLPDDSCHEPVQVLVRPVPAEEAADLCLALTAQRTQWRARVANGDATTDEDPFPFGTIVRTYDIRGLIADLRTGWMIDDPQPGQDEFRDLVTSQLPLPPEFESQAQDLRS